MRDILGSKATTEQKLSRNQRDEKQSIYGKHARQPLAGELASAVLEDENNIYMLYIEIETMVLCLPNRSLVLLSARQLSRGKLQVGLCKTERRAHHDP